LWSLGALLYTLLCGVGPFTGTGREILVKKNNAIVRFEIVQPSDNAQRLVRSLLQKDPRARISVDEILCHPWMEEADIVLARRELDLALEMFGDWGRKMS
jgi:serine/threonine protein kinase